MADYIKINDRQYRVSHCFEALSMFAELTGRNTLEQMCQLDGMTPNDIKTMMFCAVYSGEKLEGRELDIKSPTELGLLVGIADMSEYVKIFAKQMNTGLKKDQVASPQAQEVEVKKKKSLWQRLKGRR